MMGRTFLVSKTNINPFLGDPTNRKNIVATVKFTEKGETSGIHRFGRKRNSKIQLTSRRSKTTRPTSEQVVYQARLLNLSLFE